LHRAPRRFACSQRANCLFANSEMESKINVAKLACRQQTAPLFETGGRSGRRAKFLQRAGADGRQQMSLAARLHAN
jgi:hypothetical protein